jgi:RNA polymerase sigma-70 factor (ECF subfamily)
MAIYDAPLTSASIRITGNETKGRAMAEALYAELLYGFRREDGQDEKLRCPLDSYQGRGSLLGWMGKLLAQRSVDGFRRVRRETPFDPVVHDKPREAVDAHPVPEELSTLGKALAMAVSGLSAEDRFLLAAYFLDGRTLRQIGQLLDPTVHESTVSRRLKDLLDAVRKQVLGNLQTQGLSKRAAQEALEADPRDLDVNLKKLLQASQNETFRERTGE